jgi:hypothetical protein
MAEPRLPDPVLLVVATFGRHADALTWAAEHLEDLFGPVGLFSQTYEFRHTSYYEATMGPQLSKRFLAFQNLVAADCLATLKLQTNRLEKELAGSGRFPEPRPLNLDPGLLSLGKFLLATTKDQAHRIYLSDGIFAEVTLRYDTGAFEPWPWTYADYREPFVRSFLKEARGFYRQRLKEVRHGTGAMDGPGARPGR